MQHAEGFGQENHERRQPGCGSADCRLLDAHEVPGFRGHHRSKEVAGH